MRVRDAISRSSADALGQPRLRILMVLESDFTQRGGGGAESQVRTLSRYLQRIGQRVAIITPLLARGPQATAERCYRIPVGRLRYPRRPLLGGGVMCLRFAAFLWQGRHRYDAWHVHIGHHLGAVACFVGAIVGKPVIVKISGSWELEQGLLAPGRGPFARVARFWLKRATAVQAISTRIAGELRQRGFPADRVVVLPNAIDPERFALRAAPRAETAPFTALFVGRLVEEKGLPTLLDAWARAFAGRTDVRLRIVGTGELEAALRAQAERLGINAQVELVGHRDRVEDELAEADIGLLTSRIEGLSNTLLEFMAAGLPVVATRISGSEDFIVPGQNGWLFPVADTEALAACLRQAAALSRVELAALGRNARRDVTAMAAIDRVVARLLALYRGTHPRELGKVG